MLGVHLFLHCVFVYACVCFGIVFVCVTVCVRGLIDYKFVDRSHDLLCFQSRLTRVWVYSRVGDAMEDGSARLDRQLSRYLAWP